MITTRELCTWMHSAFPGTGFYRGPSIEVGDLDLHVIVTGTSGAGFDLEGAVDQPGFQARTIGVEGNEDDAERFSLELDTFLVGGPFPTDIAGKRVITIGRTGGAPTSLSLSETNRSNYVCTYLVQQEATHG